MRYVNQESANISIRTTILPHFPSNNIHLQRTVVTSQSTATQSNVRSAASESTIKTKSKNMRKMAQVFAHDTKHKVCMSLTTFSICDCLF